jgi:hypothetical protein
MDLVDRVETTRFLGGEFLLWLWYLQETNEQPASGGPFAVVMAPLRLAEALSPAENVVVHGRNACGSAEARQALRQGKLPTKAGLLLERDGESYTLSLDANRWAISGLKLPEPEERNAEDDRLGYRMELLERVEDWIEMLFADFLKFRLAEDWEQTTLPRLQAWIASDPAQAIDTNELPSLEVPA